MLQNPIRKDRKPLQDLIPLKQPLRVQIDPCNLCNFKCEFCFQNYGESFKGNVMSLELFERVLSQLEEFETPINIIHLYCLGEPLLNKNIAKFVSMIKERNIAKEVAITSNGSRLNKKLSQELIAAGLDRLSISLNGINDEHFKKWVHSSVDFAKMYEEICYFYEISGGGGMPFARKNQWRMLYGKRAGAVYQYV